MVWNTCQNFDNALPVPCGPAEGQIGIQVPMHYSLDGRWTRCGRDDNRMTSWAWKQHHRGRRLGREPGILFSTTLGQAMCERELVRQRVLIERRLGHEIWDFTTTYLAVSDLLGLIKTRPSIGCPQTIAVLEGVLRNSDFSSETQAFFLYRQAAEALVTMVVDSMGALLASQALATLEGLLGETQGRSHRASTEALGSLPVSVQGPGLSRKPLQEVPLVGWDELVEKTGTLPGASPTLLGRSLVAATGSPDLVLVVKLAQDKQAVQLIYEEAIWMECLHNEKFSFPVRFNIPVPIKIRDSYVYRLNNLPSGARQAVDSGGDCHGMAFLAPGDYFAYPNDHRPGRRLPPDQFLEVMSRNAWLFGKLAAQGIVHSAPIPLFHNRVQRNRRPDGGYYEWQRGGRLDRWLHSCRYPNFGVTGVRDFEHLISFSGSSRRLCYHIGTELLGLLLTASSYFRNKDIGRLGIDEKGNPVDARDLFDKPFFQEVIQGIFCNYYSSFCGKDLEGNPPFRINNLASRMIEEMGVDRHMEEILRVVDQEGMSEGAFREFLLSRGYRVEEIENLNKGEQDIVIHTGPHLGGFNERISLPELIESVSAMSALCIAGKWSTENVHSGFLHKAS